MPRVMAVINVKTGTVVLRAVYRLSGINEMLKLLNMISVAVSTPMGTITLSVLGQSRGGAEDDPPLHDIQSRDTMTCRRW